jgi:hypothetical protein
MLSAAAALVLIVCATLVAAIPFLLAEREQRRRSRAMRKSLPKRASVP